MKTMSRYIPHQDFQTVHKPIKKNSFMKKKQQMMTLMNLKNLSMSTPTHDM